MLQGISDTRYVEVRFIDPSHLRKFPKGKQMKLKAGINRHTTLSDKRGGINQLMALYDKLFKEGFNPITELQPKPEDRRETVLTMVTNTLPKIERSLYRNRTPKNI